MEKIISQQQAAKLLKEDDSLILVNLDGKDCLFAKIMPCDDDSLDNYSFFAKIEK